MNSTLAWQGLNRLRIVRAEGGLAGYAHGAGPHFATDLAVENVDFVEVNSLEAMEPLYRAWNCGYPVVASAYSLRVSCFSASLFQALNAMALLNVLSIQWMKYSASCRERTGRPSTITHTGIVAANG